MLRSLLPIATLTIALLSTGCSNAQAPTEVTPLQFAAKADKESYLLLDVRTTDEWNKGHLKDAVHIDWYGKEFKEKVAALDKSKPILVYCAAGGRSSSAQEAMIKLGFKNVVNLDGGYEEWLAAGQPVVK